MSEEAPRPPDTIIRLWTPLSIAVYSIILAFPAAVVLAVRNWRALGMYKEAGRHVLGACVLAIPLIGLLLYSSRAGRMFSLALNITAFAYLKAKLRSDIEVVRAANPGYTVVYRSWYSALGWAFLGLTLFILLALIISFSLVLTGVDLG